MDTDFEACTGEALEAFCKVTAESDVHCKLCNIHKLLSYLYAYINSYFNYMYT